jgi:hypothetical protein
VGAVIRNFTNPNSPSWQGIRADLRVHYHKKSNTQSRLHSYQKTKYLVLICNYRSQNVKTQLTTQRTGGYFPGSFVNPGSSLGSGFEITGTSGSLFFF